MSQTSKSTAVLPTKYNLEELKGVDPRFFVGKDMIVFTPYEIEGAPPPEKAIVMNTLLKSKTLIFTQEIQTIQKGESENSLKKQKT